jgi:ribonuclease E
MASEYEPTDQQDTDQPDTGVETPENGEKVDPAPEEPAAPDSDTATVTEAPESDAAPAPRTRTRKTATKSAKATAKATAKTATARTAKATAGGTAKVAKATRTTKKAAATKAAPASVEAVDADSLLIEAPEPAVATEPTATEPTLTEAAAPVKRGRRRSARPAEEPSAADTGTPDATGSPVDVEALRFDQLEAPAEPSTDEEDESDVPPTGEGTAESLGAPEELGEASGAAAYGPLFQAPTAPSRRRRRASAPSAAPVPGSAVTETEPSPESEDTSDEGQQDETSGEGAEAGESPRRRRRRGGKGRRSRSSAGSAASEQADDAGSTDASSQEGKSDKGDKGDKGDRGGAAESETGDDAEGGSTSRRRTRRRRRSGGGDTEADEPGVTTKVRESRRDEVTALKGSTRLEAKKQRRREGREAGRRRTIITEAEFLARRESVERVMVVRHVGDRTQIGVLEDGVLVEHYISKETNVSMAGNIYLGRVQNVLPSMEAAFVDIGKGRNAVLYAGEVNWDAAGLEANQPKRIENALTSGESVLVQVTKDPMGHKGARLTSQISLPGRYLVYVPNSAMTGISRKLPDTERSRLKRILKEVVPDTAGVIVRTAAEGASEEELKADVERLTSTWADITAKAEAATGGGGKKKNKGGSAPLLLHGEPDLTVRVIRDIFNEDFAQLVVDGDQAWQEVSEYVSSVAPDLADRLTRWTSEDDLFTHFRVDEQIAKAMDRKVWLPSGGSLVIDRTEAMTVVDVNTGKFIGSGGNLEETVTKNNIEAAEEIVRQLRLRDVGGIIVIDFIDMVLETNRDLVVRRLLECLGRDRTKHQVAEVTSLGLVQMTRKRVGSGLIEVFSETCEVCGGRGIIVHSDPVDKSGNGHDHGDNGASSTGRGSNGRSRSRTRAPEPPAPPRPSGPTPAQIAAAAHAAAMKSSEYAGDLTSGDGSEPEPEAQDAPIDIVFELDLEEAATEETATEGTATEETATETLTEAATEEDVAPERSTDEALVDEAAKEGPAEEAPAEEGPVGSEPMETPKVSPPARSRRHRGRVVAPAGPPRAFTPGGDADG